MSMPHIHGHHELCTHLLSAVTTKEHHHAWLLHGPMGIGKSLLARTMAQAFLCQGTPSPCLNCHHCSMMDAESHPDFMLLEREDGKRDIPVTAMRQLLNFLSLTGYEHNRRVAIIDDAERLNRAAANALLKGLEEPAPDCLLILVCSDLARLPTTIRSRCLLQPCYALDDEATRSVLQQMGIADSILPTAVTLAQGQPGKCRCLLETEWAQRLQQWEKLATNPAQLDIGAAQQLLSGKWPPQPLRLAIAIILEQVRPLLAQLSWTDTEQALQACQQLVEAPARVEQQSIRCDQAVLGPLILLRRLFATQ